MLARAAVAARDSGVTMREIQISASAAGSVECQGIEFVERKGMGHPDTICHGVAESISAALSAAYRERSGRALACSVDKGLLVAGRTERRFGGGLVLAPMRLNLHRKVAAQRAIQTHLESKLHALDAVDVTVHTSDDPQRGLDMSMTVLGTSAANKALAQGHTLDNVEQQLRYVVERELAKATTCTGERARGTLPIC